MWSAAKQSGVLIVSCIIRLENVCGFALAPVVHHGLPRDTLFCGNERNMVAVCSRVHQVFVLGVTAFQAVSLCKWLLAVFDVSGCEPFRVCQCRALWFALAAHISISGMVVALAGAGEVQTLLKTSRWGSYEM